MSDYKQPNKKPRIITSAGKAESIMLSAFQSIKPTKHKNNKDGKK